MPTRTDPSQGMVRLAGGTFLMGSDNHYPEEGPAHRVTVDSFCIDRYPVTNAEFRHFVDVSGYVTTAERAPNAADHPRARTRMLHAGALVFIKPAQSVDLGDLRDWWRYVAGADWRHPRGPHSTIADRDRHPVVQVSYDDAVAYAKWAGKDLPTEAEWEFAARGGLEGAVYAWGDDFSPGGRQLANTWQGDFPWHNLKTDGYEGTSPVGSYPANGYGLFDMIGNVWEWTSDWYAPRHSPDVVKPYRTPPEPAGWCRERERRRLSALDPDPPEGAEGRIALERTELLPAVQSRG